MAQLAHNTRQIVTRREEREIPPDRSRVGSPRCGWGGPLRKVATAAEEGKEKADPESCKRRTIRDDRVAVASGTGGSETAETAARRKELVCSIGLGLQQPRKTGDYNGSARRE